MNIVIRGGNPAYTASSGGTIYPIAVNTPYAAAGGTGGVENKYLTVFCHYDSMLVIRDNNTVNLIF